MSKRGRSRKSEIDRKMTVTKAGAGREQGRAGEKLATQTVRNINSSDGCWNII